ncbi:MAG: hypothetical protein K1X79_03620 [Oligoflexia bacterium]|nr:hypothetical protein [Oligoflexia bacterium]
MINSSRPVPSNIGPTAESSTQALSAPPPSGNLSDYVTGWQRLRGRAETTGREHERLVSRFRQHISNIANSISPDLRQEVFREFCATPTTRPLQRRWAPIRAGELIAQEVERAYSASLQCLARRLFPEFKPTMGRFVVAHLLWLEASAGQDSELKAAITRRKCLLEADSKNAALLRQCLQFDSVRSGSKHTLRLREIKRDIKIITREGVAIRSTRWAEQLKQEGRGIAALSRSQRSALGLASAQALQSAGRGIFGLSERARSENARAGGLAENSRKWTKALEAKLVSLVRSCRLPDGRADWAEIARLWDGGHNKNTLEQRWQSIRRKAGGQR